MSSFISSKNNVVGSETEKCLDYVASMEIPRLWAFVVAYVLLQVIQAFFSSRFMK